MKKYALIILAAAIIAGLAGFKLYTSGTEAANAPDVAKSENAQKLSPAAVEQVPAKENAEDKGAMATQKHDDAQTQQKKPPARTSIALEAIECLKAGEFAEMAGYFDSKIAPSVQKMMSEKWPGVVSKIGDIQSVKKPIGSGDYVQVECKFEKATMFFLFTFDKSDKITNLNLSDKRQ